MRYIPVEVSEPGALQGVTIWVEADPIEREESYQPLRHPCRCEVVFKVRPRDTRHFRELLGKPDEARDYYVCNCYVAMLPSARAREAA